MTCEGHRCFVIRSYLKELDKLKANFDCYKKVAEFPKGMFCNCMSD